MVDACPLHGTLARKNPMGANAVDIGKPGSNANRPGIRATPARVVLNSYLYKSGRLNQFFTVSRYRNITTSNQSSTGRRCDRRKRNTRLKFCSATACSAGDSGLSWAGTSYPSSQNNVSWGVCSGCSAGGACSASGGGCSDSGPVRITPRLSNVNRNQNYSIYARGAC